jgi:hypothetical protein
VVRVERFFGLPQPKVSRAYQIKNMRTNPAKTKRTITKVSAAPVEETGVAETEVDGVGADVGVEIAPGELKMKVNEPLSGASLAASAEYVTV